MLGFNEYQEALNLWELLEASKEWVEEFNHVPETARTSPKGEAWTEDEAADQELTLYLKLALRMEQRRLSGRYALRFAAADEAQRHPYELLSRLDVQEGETTAHAFTPEQQCLLAGLTPEQRLRLGVLYHRLMYVKPMRILFERLSQLAHGVRQQLRGESGVQRRSRLLRIIQSPQWRRKIDSRMEGGSVRGPSLDVVDNGFSILDRIMDNWDRPLKKEGCVVLPDALMKETDCPELLLTTAMMHRMKPEEKQRRGMSFHAIPGGHTALGVYSQESLGTFSKRVRTACTRGDGKRPMAAVRSYARYMLVSLSDEACRALTEARTAAGKEAWAAIANPFDAVEKDSGASWQCVAEELCALQAADAPAAWREDGWCSIPDEGGASLCRAVSAAMQQEDPQQISHEDVRNFFRGVQQSREEQLRAVRSLRLAISGLMDGASLEPQCSPKRLDTISNVGKKGKSWQTKALLLLLAYLQDQQGCADRWQSVACDVPMNGVPQAVETLLQQMERSPEICRSFAAFHGAVARDEKPLCCMLRCDVQGDHLRLSGWLGAMPEMDAMESWMKADGQQEPAFTPEELKRCARQGLIRFLVRRKGFGTNESESKPFSFEISRCSRVDRVWQLTCLYVLTRCAPTLAAELRWQEDEALESRFHVAGGWSMSLLEALNRMSQLTGSEMQQLAADAYRHSLTMVFAPEERTVQLSALVVRG